MKPCRRCGDPHPRSECRDSIYGLVDPRDNTVRYVGRTITSLKARLEAHYSEIYLARPKNQWLRELRAVGLRAFIVLLDQVRPEDGAMAERAWVVELDGQHPLTNCSLKAAR